MDKMWAGRFAKPVAKVTDEFNSSIKVDGRMYESDIRGSLAHAEMLSEKGIITADDFAKIKDGLNAILSDIKAGTLAIDENAEDVHMFVEGELTKRIGDAGKRLHTARSRNDQVATDTRLYLSGRIEQTKFKIKELIGVLAEVASEHTETVMPGYTHLQRAQPVTLAQHLLAYCAMLIRDCDRLDDCKKRTLILPLGSCALAGTTYPIDRFSVAEKLGMLGVSFNSMDGVSDRDFVIELCSVISIVMAHLSRLAEEMIMWCSWEFRFMELDDAYSTGSSIMPQKKNPDLCELVRGKTGRVYGNLMSILTVIKGLPLAYNKDMQEDKEGVFDSCDTVDDCLTVTSAMLKTARFNKENMLNACKKGFINATDVADYLTKKGMPFRSAYKLTGELVAKCISLNKTLDTLTIKEYKEASELFEEDIYEAVDVINCAFKRNSYGGPAKESTQTQIKIVKEFLEKDND